MTKKILIINGPNLNMLGTRQPEIYGDETLSDVEERLEALAESIGLDVEFFQSNHEGEIVTRIQQARQGYEGVIINAGGYTHTSVAIHDAIKMVGVPVIEVHISNIYAREQFRHHSLISPVASGIIAGLGTKGYELALKSFL
jgi:3-dehydroquinate dehydratase-2